MVGTNSTKSNLIVSVEDVVWKRKGEPILNGINWAVHAGEHWAILGLNGCGKTSLLNMISGYEWPSSGKVYVLGQQLGKIDLHELRKKIGLVSLSMLERYQSRGHLSVLEVALSGKFASIGLYEQVTDSDREQAAALLEKFRVLHLAEKPFFTLSQGEKQKVLIARAWMANPTLIILDEPCNGLDILAREDLLHTIEELAANSEGPTLLYVTHRTEEIMPSFSHALLLKEGQVVAQGKKDEVLTEKYLEETFQLPLNLRWEHGRLYLSGRYS